MFIYKTEWIIQFLYWIMIEWIYCKKILIKRSKEHLNLTITIHILTFVNFIKFNITLEINCLRACDPTTNRTNAIFFNLLIFNNNLYFFMRALIKRITNHAVALYKQTNKETRNLLSHSSFAYYETSFSVMPNN